MAQQAGRNDAATIHRGIYDFRQLKPLQEGKPDAEKSFKFYFALAAMIHRFAYLKYALALILVFIGGKIFLVNIVGKIPAPWSLGITTGLIVGGVLVSLWKTRGAAAARQA